MTAFETILYPNNIFKIPLTRPRRIIITILDDDVATTQQSNGTPPAQIPMLDSAQVTSILQASAYTATPFDDFETVTISFTDKDRWEESAYTATPFDDFETPIDDYLIGDESDMINLALASEAVLARTWLTPEEDAAWAHLSQLPSL